MKAHQKCMNISSMWNLAHDLSILFDNTQTALSNKAVLLPIQWRIFNILNRTFRPEFYDSQAQTLYNFIYIITLNVHRMTEQFIR